MIGNNTEENFQLFFKLPPSYSSNKDKRMFTYSFLIKWLYLKILNSKVEGYNILQRMQFK